MNMNPLISGNPWRPPPSGHSHPAHVYSNPYVYDAAAAVALVGGYSPYTASYSPHMDLAGRRKNATRETTATLKAWLYEHRKNPYPTKSEKVYLAIMTKMTLTQVSTWFANARRRLKKENKMTWSPRNRTNDDDEDDRHAETESHSTDLTDDEEQCQSPSIVTKQLNHSFPSSTTTTTTTTLSYPLTVLHHHQEHLTQNKDETSRKRKSDEIDNSSNPSKKKSSAIWSLADMAEKNENKKTILSNGQISMDKTTISNNEKCLITSKTTPMMTMMSGAFKPLK